jgi:uncharacterized protein YyaL (SSP411 family)
MSANREKKPNRLLAETSPYLAQHAYNPVDWYPWGDEALRKARELDRPIFLSIGYSSCHWCHVMERESFENVDIAKLMNEHFINIKVDREERPDLDSIYMTAVQLLTSSGGWPMSVFLTPELKPFWGGTYFPPDDRFGRPGFAHILTQIANLYRTGRDKIEETAAKLTEALSERDTSTISTDLPGRDVMESAVEYAERSFDSEWGGFGPAPKFPRSVEISKLLRYYQRTKKANVLEMCEATLESMAHGGMYDQIGGGFHRYSTDKKWLVPHFEKMLYDNALLARTYLEAFQVTGKDFYSRIAREVLDYVLREMTSPEGGFYSATDADSEGEEGVFFVWTPEQVEEVLGEADARTFCEYYSITTGGNFEGGTSIPHVSKPVEEVAGSLNLSCEKLEEVLERGRRKLYEARESRVKPFRDEKVLASWNGLMISAFARGYQILEDPRYLEAADRAAAFIVENLYFSDRLHRTYKDGRCQFPGYLDDHAYLGEAFLDLYETTFKPEHLQFARELTDTLLEQFWDAGGGGFFFTALHHKSLITRKKDPFDNATPSGNGVAALSLLRLERLTGVDSYRARAVELFKGVKPLVEKAPMAFSYTILALEYIFNVPVEIAVLGNPEAEETRKLLRVVYQRFLPNKALVAVTPPVDQAMGEAVPLLAGKSLEGEKATAFVCRDYACRTPVTEPRDLERLLASPS